jgi:hypothetical protein
VDGQGIAFCPYCGEKLPEAAEVKTPARKDPEAEKWIDKALAQTSYPDRKKILLKGKEACPDSAEIDWELLFIGEQGPRKGKVIDYSIIKCWVLEIYHNPGAFSEERRTAMRGELFDSPALKSCLARFEDPGRKQKEYLLRLCRDYIEIFLEGNSSVMGIWFGFQVERNKEKKLAPHAAGIIAAMKKDEKLLPEQREQLWQSFYQAYAARMNGKTEHLDSLLKTE